MQDFHFEYKKIDITFVDATSWAMETLWARGRARAQHRDVIKTIIEP
jgi:hypothetical protein